MAYPDAQTLGQSFRVTYQIISLQTDGLTHADCVVQPPFRGNCLNWVLGHIIAGRNSALNLLGRPAVLEATEVGRYESGSEPITTDGQALPLEALLKALDLSQLRLAAALERSTPEDLAKLVPFRGDERPLGEAIAGLHWHETYHTGQLELLRQLSGKNDAII